MTTSASAALLLSDASASFGATPALAGITGSVARGGSVALIGPNGAGKTTLIRAIIGAVPLERGTIEVLGTTPKRARGRVADRRCRHAIRGRHQIIADHRAERKTQRWIISGQTLDQIGSLPAS